MGEIGWRPDDFWSADFRTLSNAMDGWRETETARTKAAFERIRWATIRLGMPHIQKKGRKDWNKICGLPWDRDELPEKPTLSAEEIARQLAESERLAAKVTRRNQMKTNGSIGT